MLNMRANSAASTPEARNPMTQQRSFDLAVIGGGLAGLAAATYAARAGRSVVLFERAPQVGGRATTQNRDGYLFNQGPHALYRAGHGVGVLRELGISWHGAPPAPEGSWAMSGGRNYLLPRTPVALQESGLLSPEAAMETASVFARLTPQYDLTPWQHRSWREWLASEVTHPETRALLGGLMRLSTYCNDDAVQSAGAALSQFIMGGAGVDYLDGGWQSLVDSLRDAAMEAGVQLETRSAVDAIHSLDSKASIRLVDGQLYEVRAAISTVSPNAIAAAVNDGKVAALRQWAREATPIHAGCLDIALRRLPNPQNQFAIGLDRPLYYSVHTRSARLAPEGGAIIQLAKYHSSGAEDTGAEVEQELETLMDELQPGWRDELVAKRFLPRMLVANAIAAAAQGGTSGRPGPAVPEIANLFVAGDWVGPHGMLADASLASARDATALALEWLGSSAGDGIASGEFAVVE